MARTSPRAYAHLRNYMDDQHVNGEGRTFSSRHGRLVRAICRGTDGLNPGHRSPLSGASLCRLQYRYEMCVRPSGSLGLNSAILVEAIDAPAATAGSGAAEAKCTISIIRQGQNGIFQS